MFILQYDNHAEKKQNKISYHSNLIKKTEELSIYGWYDNSTDDILWKMISDITLQKFPQAFIKAKAYQLCDKENVEPVKQYD